MIIRNILMAIIAIAVVLPVVAAAQVGVDVEVDVSTTSTAPEVDYDPVQAGDAQRITVEGDERIQVEYSHAGRLFGLFPVMVKSVTVVDVAANGATRVSTRMPWWNLFVTGTGGVRDGVDAAVADMRSDTPEAQARLIQLITEAHIRADAQGGAR